MIHEILEIKIQMVLFTDGWTELNWKSLSRVRCLTLCDPMDYAVHEILQARIL